ncbi:MAG: A/G-specific adenine glycosylase [Nitrospirota bacterium]
MSSRPFSTRLLRWYQKNGRDLPWRKTTDPYTIWVSEILLQQTQVVTALPYYHRFLERFPTVHALATTPLDDVLKTWQGLGYYARARHLSLAAQKVVREYNGNIPRSLDALMSLAGIGRSTAGAILNIAFNQCHPILDGNVKRILSRYFLVRGDLKEKNNLAVLWAYAEAILPKKKGATPANANLFTQAIMDLGATICLPKSPNCVVCPVSLSCLAYQEGVQNKLPEKSVSKKVPHYDFIAAIIQKGKQVLIKKRPEKGLLGGLWEFPGGKIINKDDLSSIHELTEREVGQQASLIPLDVQIQHAFTHFKMTLHLFSGVVQKRIACNPALKWVSISQLSDYAFSAAHQVIVLKLQEGTE